MTEVFEHNPGDHEDPLPGPTWMIGFLGAVLLSVIVLGLTALFYNAKENEHKIKVIERDPMELEHLRASQIEVLVAQPRWVEELVMTTVDGKEVEKPERALAIPIDQAMQLVVNEAQGGTHQ